MVVAMRTFLGVLAIGISGCALSHGPEEPAPPEDVAEPASCDQQGPVVTLVGAELVRIDADGTASVLHELTGEGTEAAALGAIEPSSHALLVGPDHAVASVFWYPRDVPFRGSQEIVLMDRDGSLIWRKTLEGDEVGARLFLHGDGAVSMQRTAGGRPADGAIVREDGAIEPVPGDVHGEPFASGALLLRRCPEMGACEVFWWQPDGTTRPIGLAAGYGFRRVGDQIAYVDPDGALIHEGPRLEPTPLDLPLEGEASIVGSTESGWILVDVDARSAEPRHPYRMVHLDTGEVRSVGSQDLNRTELGVVGPVLEATGAIVRLSRDEDRVALERSEDGDAWTTVVDPYVADGLLGLVALKGRTLLAEHHAADEWEHSVELIETASGRRHPMDQAPSAGQLTGDGACLVSWERATEEAEAESVLGISSLRSSDRREVLRRQAVDAHPPTVWAEGW
jgi:hypothetical protein